MPAASELPEVCNSLSVRVSVNRSTFHLHGIVAERAVDPSRMPAGPSIRRAVLAPDYIWRKEEND
jgi:hypothetical protein